MYAFELCLLLFFTSRSMTEMWKKLEMHCQRVKIIKKERLSVNILSLSFLLPSIWSITHPWKALFHFSFLTLWRGIWQLQGGYQYRTTQTHNKPTETSMYWVGFEPTIPVSERTKTVHASNRVATVMDCPLIYEYINHYIPPELTKSTRLRREGDSAFQAMMIVMMTRYDRLQTIRAIMADNRYVLLQGLWGIS
jgi:hypothetical protein